MKRTVPAVQYMTPVEAFALAAKLIADQYAFEKAGKTAWPFLTHWIVRLHADDRATLSKGWPTLKTATDAARRAIEWCGDASQAAVVVDRNGLVLTIPDHKEQAS